MIRIRNLTMTYRSSAGEHQAVRGVSLDVPQGQFYTLLGPSGCGKTTTLRCVGGLERPDSGEITIGDQIVCSSDLGIWVEPNDRKIGMVFQSYAIWPHMNVFDNVAFPLRYLKPRPSPAKARDMVRSVLALVKLDGLEERPAPFLSGGQQQRLALARALVAEPSVLLLDEPLSNLDAKLREEMRVELRDLVKRLDVTTLFVTHEQIEALTMSDVMAVMSDGVIKQEGAPADIYAAPNEQFVADFIGKMNFLPGTVCAREDRNGSAFARVETAIGTLACRCSSEVASGDPVTIAVRPENLDLGGNANGDGNTLEGEVALVVYLGNLIDCAIRIGDEQVRAQLHPSAKLTTGDRVTVTLPADQLMAMPR